MKKITIIVSFLPLFIHIQSVFAYDNFGESDDQIYDWGATCEACWDGLIIEGNGPATDWSWLDDLTNAYNFGEGNWDNNNDSGNSGGGNTNPNQGGNTGNGNGSGNNGYIRSQKTIYRTKPRKF
jgi:hypothetical protein